MKEPKQSFLNRWSRLKRQATQRPEGAAQVPAHLAVEAEVSEAPPIELPPIESVDLETGVAAFFKPGVQDALKRTAVRKLFSDPHFNVMDGLDVYVDDYTRPDPIPQAMLQELEQFKTLFREDSTGSADRQPGEPSAQEDSRTPVAPREESPSLDATSAEPPNSALTENPPLTDKIAQAQDRDLS